jgi:hypothetical protein
MMELARGSVAKIPELFAVGEVETSEGIADLVVSVEQIDSAAADGWTAIADADRERPEDLGAFLGPGS